MSMLATIRLAPIPFTMLVLSLIFLNFAPTPFFFVWLTWSAFSLLCTLTVRGPYARAGLLNLGVITATLAAAEAYFAAAELPPSHYERLHNP